MGWREDTVIMYGTCPRFYHQSPAGDICVETHSEECRRECKSRKGWTVVCAGVGFYTPHHLKATTPTEAQKEALALVVQRLRSWVDEISP